MSSCDRSLTAQRWDAEYRQGRYLKESAIPFVDTILTTLQAHTTRWYGKGLDVGCGNGRNYLPLVDAGLNIIGLDVSAESIRQLAERRPGSGGRLVCTDFRDYRVEESLSYIVAIQVFQHGLAADVATYFRKVRELLQPGGLFFLRVNAASTQVYHRHTIIEQGASGGFTIRYDDGPKRGLPVHFYSRDELAELTAAAFDSVMAPHEDIMHRTPPKVGFWSQWEAIWKKAQ